MINHARTLLLNIDGNGGSGFSNFPGEEFIPPDYTAVTLSTPLQRIRDMLFGPNPDRIMLNYRGRQLLGLLHTTELVEFVTELDPRITYDVLPQDQFFKHFFDTVVTPVGGTVKQLYIQGTITPNDAGGRVQHQWLVRVTSSETVEVTRLTAPVSLANIEYTVEDGLSSIVPLAGSSLSVRFPAGIGSQWYITAATRPGTDLGSLMAAIDSLTEDIRIELFGVGSQLGASEPFKTFRNLYKMHPELPYRMGGILLAQIYQIDRRRQLQQ